MPNLDKSRFFWLSPWQEVNVDLTPGKCALFLRAVQEIPGYMPERERRRFSQAILSALRDPEAPGLELNDQELGQLEELLKKLKLLGIAAMDTACLISLSRVRREMGWNPLRLPTAAQLAKDPKDYLIIRNALGVLALAWQVRVRPDNVILNCDEFVSLFEVN